MNFGRNLAARTSVDLPTLRSVAVHPSAFIPVAMSCLALGVVALALATGTERQSDEGAAAHVWQLLMAAQLPIVAFFAISWPPRAPKRATIILVVQFVAALAALAPVFLLHL